MKPQCPKTAPDADVILANVRNERPQLRRILHQTRLAIQKLPTPRSPFLEGVYQKHLRVVQETEAKLRGMTSAEEAVLRSSFFVLLLLLLLRPPSPRRVQQNHCHLVWFKGCRNRRRLRLQGPHIGALYHLRSRQRKWQRRRRLRMMMMMTKLRTALLARHHHPHPSFGELVLRKLVR